MADLPIVDVEAIPCSISLATPVRMGVGTVVKREAVIVKVTTADGVVGFGEAHHARAPAAVAAIVNTTMRDLLIGQSALGSEKLWSLLFRNQLATHGTGAAGACALSGIDIALWDVRARALGVPVFHLLGGSPTRIPAYAGGISLGFQDPAALVDEVRGFTDAGFRAVKLRIGHDAAADVASVAAVRDAFPDLVILTDANARYNLEQARYAAGRLAGLGVGWLEEPFPPFARDLYATLRALPAPPLAAGENHYSVFEFRDLIESRTVDYLQPDASKCGGITSMMRIAALASAAFLPVCPHTSPSAVNMAATLQVLACLPDARWYEAEAAKQNPLRDELASRRPIVGADGCVSVYDGPGLGVEVDEAFLRAHPLTPGLAFVPD